MTKGKRQAEAYVELAKPWQADQIGGIKIGDVVRLPNIEATFQVVAIADPFLTLRAPSVTQISGQSRATLNDRQFWFP